MNVVGKSMCKVFSQYRLAKLTYFCDAALEKFGMQAFDLQGSWQTERHSVQGLSGTRDLILISRHKLYHVALHCVPSLFLLILVIKVRCSFIAEGWPWP